MRPHQLSLPGSLVHQRPQPLRLLPPALDHRPQAVCLLLPALDDGPDAQGLGAPALGRPPQQQRQLVVRHGASLATVDPVIPNPLGRSATALSQPGGLPPGGRLLRIANRCSMAQEPGYSRSRSSLSVQGSARTARAPTALGRNAVQGRPVASQAAPPRRGPRNEQV
jgi:hypothetical protein